MTTDVQTSDGDGFRAPGPGAWMLDTTHHGRRPVTPFLRDVYARSFARGFPQMAERYGMPLQEMKVAFVHGRNYARPVPVGGGDRPRAAPPKPVMWVLARAHPELRRRTRTAAAAWAERRWRHDVDNWFEKEREEVIHANLAHQRADVSQLDDDELVTHLRELLDHLEYQFTRSFTTHGGDIVPVGDLLAHTEQWGIDAGEVTALLAGSSPMSTETVELLAPVSDALASTPATPTSVQEVRQLSPEAATAVDRWLELHGWRLLTSDDLDAPTLHERPALQLRALLQAGQSPGTTEPDPSAVRSRVPAAERERFDELLSEARYGLRLRDDNVGTRVNWPAGLVRRAVREAGRRLEERGVLRDVDEAVCLTVDEVGPLLAGRGGPTSQEVRSRVEERERQLTLDPPAALGEPEDPPPLDAMPEPLARSASALFALISAMNGDGERADLHGIGVGDTPYRARACVVTGPDDALERLEPGDVLVAAYTSPSFNSILPIVGAMAVEEGGPMSHTAIVAREFGIPAVVGASGCTRLVVDGSQVEVDPVAGVVRPLD